MPEERIEFKNARSESVVAVIHRIGEGSTKAVIVSHGFGGNKDKPWIRDLCQHLAETGIDGVRIDFSGNGESGGHFEEMTYQKEADDLVSCLDALSAKGYRTFGLVGHSMGGAVSLMTGARDHRVKAVVNISGVAWPAIEKHVKFVKEFYEKAFEKPISSDTFLESLKSVDVIGAVRTMKAPLLTIHGDADEVVSIDEGRAIMDAANEPKKMIIAMGAGHRLSQDAGFASECIELSVEWMEKYLL